MSVCVTRSRSSVQTRLGSIDLDWLKWGLRWATTDTQAVPTVRRLQESETCQCLDFGQNGAIIGSKLRHDTHFLSTLVVRKHSMASPSILPRSSILLFSKSLQTILLSLWPSRKKLNTNIKLLILHYNIEFWFQCPPIVSKKHISAGHLLLLLISIWLFWERMEWLRPGAAAELAAEWVSDCWECHQFNTISAPTRPTAQSTQQQTKSSLQWRHQIFKKSSRLENGGKVLSLISTTGFLGRLCQVVMATETEA